MNSSINLFFDTISVLFHDQENSTYAFSGYYLSSLHEQGTHAFSCDYLEIEIK